MVWMWGRDDDVSVDECLVGGRRGTNDRTKRLSLGMGMRMGW